MVSLGGTLPPRFLHGAASITDLGYCEGRVPVSDGALVYQTPGNSVHPTTGCTADFMEQELPSFFVPSFHRIHRDNQVSREDRNNSILIMPRQQPETRPETSRELFYEVLHPQQKPDTRK